MENLKVNNKWTERDIVEAVKNGNTLYGVVGNDIEVVICVKCIHILYNNFNESELEKYYIDMLKNSELSYINFCRDISIQKAIIEQIFEKKSVAESVIKKNSRDMIVLKFLNDCINAYRVYLKEKVRKCAVDLVPLTVIPNTFARNGEKVIALTGLEEKIYKRYIKEIIYKVLEENTKPMKLDEEIKYKFSKELMGNEKALYNLYDSRLKDSFYKLDNDIMEQYKIVANELVCEYIRNKRKLADLDKTYMTYIQKFNQFFRMSENDIKTYLQYYVDKYTLDRKTVSFMYLIEEVFGAKRIGNFKIDNKERGVDKYYEELKRIVDEIYSSQGEELLKNNENEVDLKNDKWIITYEEGPKYHKKEFDFSKIISKEFRYEVKLYIIEELKCRNIKNINTLSLVTTCLNYICENRNEVRCFGDIEVSDVTKLYYYLQNEYITIHNKQSSPSTIQKQIKRLGLITKYLIKYDKRNRLMTEAPKDNIFDDIKFKNIENMHKKTDIIPEIVIEQLEKHINCLQPRFRLMFEIFINSGIRLKEVMTLKENCLDFNKLKGSVVMEYTPYKVENVAKRKSRPPENEIVIPLFVAELINKQINSTEKLREQYNSKNIFIHLNDDKGYYRANLTSSNSFAKAINALIKSKKIVDYNGELWKFTTRQSRKTIAVMVLENGGTMQELAYILGHFNQVTLQKYYAAVREKKIEELNTEFYKNKFKIDIGQECLDKFTEAERKVLYIEFLSEYRKVELGYCSKHFSEGPCGSRIGKVSCANCEKICTGIQFIDKWYKLRDEQIKITTNLADVYKKGNIKYEDYAEFREYEIEVYYLKMYQEVIDKIIKGV